MDNITKVRAKINALDITRKNLVEELLSYAVSQEEKFDLWMEYAHKKDYTCVLPGFIGEKLSEFISNLHEREVVKEGDMIYTEELVAFIYEDYIELGDAGEVMLSKSGEELLTEIMIRNIGTISVNY